MRTLSWVQKRYAQYKRDGKDVPGERMALHSSSVRLSEAMLMVRCSLAVREMKKCLCW